MVGRRGVLAAAAGLVAARRAAAQPVDRPVRLVVGFPPGGPTDFIARLVAQSLGSAVVVENRAGANATVATAAVAQAPPDGTTLLLAANNHVMNPGLYPRLPYDPAASFAPVGRIATSPNVFWAGYDQPWQDLPAVLAAARARPGELAYATTGNGGNGHFGGETLARAAGIRLAHVPYRGTAPAMQDVIAGRVPLTCGTLVGTIGGYRARQIRPLAVFGPRRAPELPDTPTLEEFGYRVADSAVWYGLLAPASTAANTVQRLAGELETVLRQPAVVERLASQASVADFSGPEAFATQIRQELPRWAEVARAAGMQAD